MPKTVSKREDVRKVVQKKIAEGLDVTNIDALPEAETQQYAQMAKQILLSPVWQNETKRLISGWVEFLAIKAVDFDQVRDMRMCVNAIQVLQEQLEQLAAREGLKTTLKDPFAGV